ncbi:MAG: hypothetical protein A2W61_03495 [Deltaproteobacteria bacterium RIFCSPLOWO2_01_44_7]|nr:MAG: hypothetical protein A2712_06365 [Deltaproteobacteria bacterium RIFCSPHIGHO2_01_FULL_43_49]OGQ15995.1 MAG: hypothetical protein A3D22_06305 [Deltaproteobacteria bacterium RIFCSPHIGHO2_02_FULL_44_53]OGQ33177.1 MAG: hypothetical protein A2979_04135 [Deltaproteobacteria bacterium RIFCSPLOWO2_01_FULL_45_74]OGQ41631.1 MAG: hypothetical protein A2W61_03495 [Deltaproteobacteria bacterium RIFCSPLOWO2_01_44_7]OGQ42273.1 MAG: hypothetical protein A3I70_06440 [Deltaproteobacteria bacterium RIFCSPL
MAPSFGEALSRLRQEFPRYLIEAKITRTTGSNTEESNVKIDNALVALSSFANMEDSPQTITQNEYQKASEMLEILLQEGCSAPPAERRRSLMTAIIASHPWKPEWAIFIRQGLCVYADSDESEEAKELVLQMIRGFSLQGTYKKLASKKEKGLYVSVAVLPKSVSKSLGEIAAWFDARLKGKSVHVRDPNSRPNLLSFPLDGVKWSKLGFDGSLQVLVRRFQVQPNKQPIFSRRNVETMVARVVWKDPNLVVHVRVDAQSAALYALREDEEARVEAVRLTSSGEEALVQEMLMASGKKVFTTLFGIEN